DDPLVAPGVEVRWPNPDRVVVALQGLLRLPLRLEDDPPVVPRGLVAGVDVEGRRERLHRGGELPAAEELVPAGDLPPGPLRFRQAKGCPSQSPESTEHSRGPPLLGLKQVLPRLSCLKVKTHGERPDSLRGVVRRNDGEDREGPRPVLPAVPHRRLP